MTEMKTGAPSTVEVSLARLSDEVEGIRIKAVFWEEGCGVAGAAGNGIDARAPVGMAPAASGIYSSPSPAV